MTNPLLHILDREGNVAECVVNIAEPVLCPCQRALISLRLGEIHGPLQRRQLMACRIVDTRQSEPLRNRHPLRIALRVGRQQIERSGILSPRSSKAAAASALSPARSA